MIKWYRKLVFIATAAIFVETMLILMAGFSTENRWQISKKVTTTNLLLAEKYLKIQENRSECTDMLAKTDSIDKSIEKLCERISSNKVRIDVSRETPVQNFYQNLWNSSSPVQSTVVASSAAQPASSDDRTLMLTTFGTVSGQKQEPATVTPQASGVIRIVKRNPSIGRSSTQTGLSTALSAGRGAAPKAEESFVHLVSSGDSLWKLSKKYNVSLSRLQNFNNLTEANLKVGQSILIPGTAAGSDFSWPVKGRISSGYGYRVNPISKASEFHAAIDIASPLGKAVMAGQSGKVEYAGWIRGYGKTIRINHRDGYSTLYAHLSSIAVARGQVVTTNTMIGRIGTTGYSTGPHLHFEIKQKGKQVNPLKYLP
ncbi:MAG: peptidoglycan DD-metalloendopeptidase family protein [Candidatus Wallbacteria bacterium]|nr:peptidoglycan DD-metalloendopeptidase family protein [Candidatus Wallbacteria bacterium]